MPKDNFILVRKRDCTIAHGANYVTFTGDGVEAIARALSYCAGVSSNIRSEEGAGMFSQFIWDLIRRPRMIPKRSRR